MGFRDWLVRGLQRDLGWLARVLQQDFEEAQYRVAQKPMLKVKEYKTSAAQEKDMNKMARDGYMVLSETAEPSHINVGRTVTGAALTSGLSLLAGGSRTPAKHRVTYTDTRPTHGNLPLSRLPSSLPTQASEPWARQEARTSEGAVLQGPLRYQAKNRQEREGGKSLRRNQLGMKDGQARADMGNGAKSSLTAEILLLKKLMDSGVISPDEFKLAKRKLFGQ